MIVSQLSYYQIKGPFFLPKVKNKKNFFMKSFLLYADLLYLFENHIHGWVNNCGKILASHHTNFIIHNPSKTKNYNYSDRIMDIMDWYILLSLSSIDSSHAL